jgi:hypothetical protein
MQMYGVGLNCLRYDPMAGFCTTVMNRLQYHKEKYRTSDSSAEATYIYSYKGWA